MSLFKPSQQQLSQIQLPQHPVPYRFNNNAISVAVQTDYRETEVQTDPWSAPINPASDIPENQEIKDLIELTIQNGLLPAHEGTMAVIQRIREQREYDARIPPPLDPTRQPTEQELKQDAIRTQMLIERDLREWDRKERELAKYHKLRIKMLVDKLTERETARQEVRDTLLDKLAARQQATLEQQTTRLNKHAILELKKSVQSLNTTIDNQNAFNKQSDCASRIVKADFRGDPALSLPQQKSTVKLVNSCIFDANQLNAPVLRPGEAPYRFAGVIKLAGTELRTQQDFEEIMQYYDMNNGQVSERLYKPHKPEYKNQKKYSVTKEGDYLPIPRRQYGQKKGDMTKEQILARLNELENAEQNQNQNLYLQQQQQQQELINKTNNSAQIYRQFDQCPEIQNSAQNDAYLQLQNLIRGRAAQVNMQQGKDRRIGLVTELRLAHSLVEIRGQDENIKKLAQDRLEMIQEAIRAGAAANGVGQILGQSIDQLQKERIRSQQLLRTEAILQIALRERQRRESLETDQRSKEVMQRARRDYNRQIYQDAHREFVNMLIDRISKVSQDKEAETQAQDLAMRQVEAIVEQDYQASKEGAKTGYQEQLKEYLNDFLLPEVDRRYQAAKLKKDQEKWLYASVLAKQAGAAAAKRADRQESKGTETEVDENGVLKVEKQAETEFFRGVNQEADELNKEIEKKYNNKKK